MTDQEINIAVAEVLGKPVTIKKNEQGFMVRPCPDCGTHRIKLCDCGYSSFNPGWVECACGYKCKMGYVDSEKDLVKPWNRHRLAIIPRYTEDLNACNEMENTMDEQTYRMFIGHLVSLLKPGEFSVRAKARPRSIAFLKVHGKYAG